MTMHTIVKTYHTIKGFMPPADKTAIRNIIKAYYSGKADVADLYDAEMIIKERANWYNLCLWATRKF